MGDSVKKGELKAIDYFTLLILGGTALCLVAFSPLAREGASKGLTLAESTVLPSLLPLLIIFLTIMKTGAGALLSKAAGAITHRLFNLPASCSAAIIFGLTGGYPTGAVLTEELYKNGEIDEKQARRLMRFNFCGGCGFIITAIGSAVLNNLQAGLILFFSNVISAVFVGIILSFTEKRDRYEYYYFSSPLPFGDALNSAVSGAVNSVLNITAYIVIFSAVSNIINIPDFLLPLLEITGGLCKGGFGIPVTAALLSFGGVCIHLQLTKTLSQIKMKYLDFLMFRVICSLLSYGTARLFLIVFPIETAVFADLSSRQVSLTSANIPLSLLLIAGCFVIVLDIGSKKSFSNAVDKP